MVKSEVVRFKSFDRQCLEAEEIETSSMTATDSVIHQIEPLNSGHVRKLSEQLMSFFSLVSYFNL
jgi:hypothetical protein